MTAIHQMADRIAELEAELDAARAREAKLREALRVHAVNREETRSSDLYVCAICEAWVEARHHAPSNITHDANCLCAALAEGEEHKP